MKSLGRITIASFCVMVIIATFMPEPPPRKQSMRNACIANLKQIKEAKETWAREHSIAKGEIPGRTDIYGLNAYLRDEPYCPAGGIYRIMQVSENPRCCIIGHTL